MMSLVKNEMDIYYNSVTEDTQPSPKSRLQKWSGTNESELYVFLAVCLLQARNKRNEIQECWSKDPLLHSPVYSEIMSRDRFLLLLSLLHFSNNDEQPPGDRLFKIQNILNMFRQNFQKNIIPYEDICIDESLILFKGRLLFKQYIPSKRHRFGIKLFVMCDVKTGCVLDLIVYVGQQTAIVRNPELGISGSVVSTLMAPYLGKGHSLYIDNWYTSPQLATFLHRHQTNMCGTVRPNRKGLPRFSKKLKKGEVEALHTDTVMALKLKDKKDVFMLTTMHANEMVATEKIDRETKEPKRKPACVVDYNKKMGAVDRTDMMLSSIESVRKTVKWYKKFFLHLVDLSVLNAHALYVAHTKRNESLATFQLELIRELLEDHHEERVRSKGGRPSSGDTPMHLSQ